MLKFHDNYLKIRKKVPNKEKANKKSTFCG